MPGKIRGKRKVKVAKLVPVRVYGKQDKNEFTLTLQYEKVTHVLFFSRKQSEGTRPDLIVHWRSRKGEEHHSGHEYYVASIQALALFGKLGQDIIDGFKTCYLPLNDALGLNEVSAVELKGLY